MLNTIPPLIQVFTLMETNLLSVLSAHILVLEEQLSTNGVQLEGTWFVLKLHILK